MTVLGIALAVYLCIGVAVAIVLAGMMTRVGKKHKPRLLSVIKVLVSVILFWLPLLFFRFGQVVYREMEVDVNED